MLATAMLPAAVRSVDGLLADGAPGAAEELRRLRRKLDDAAGLAPDAEAREGRDASSRAWLRELRDALYELGDADADFRRAAPSGRRLESRRSFRHWFMLPPTVNGIRDKTLRTSITSLNKIFDAILNKGSELGLLSGNQEILNGRSEFTAEVVLNDDTVGDIENKKNRLIDILTDRQSANIVVSILGDSGMGKTKLAWEMHNDHRTRNAFSMIAWVSVFNDFDGIGLLSAIVSAAGGNPRGATDRMQLEAILAAMLKGKRFLLVLDGLYGHHVFENSLDAHWHVFGHGSRILITTQDGSVATKMKSAYAYIYQMKELAFQDCWSLLCRNACHDQSLHGNTLRNTGIMIIQKCNRIPMAIKIIAAVLRTKEQNKEAWQQVYESKGWSFRDLHDSVDGLTGAIYVGYHDLPSHLKQCLIYLSLFPEGSVMRQQFVCQLWVSEGFIEEQDNCNPERIAEEYYMELVSRNLLKPEIGNHDMTRCTMHEKIRSFLQFFAEDKVFSGDLKPSVNGTSSEGLRQVWIRSNKPTTTLDEIVAVASLKTVILYKNPVGNHGLDKLFKGLKYLQVLDLGGTEIKYIPTSLKFLLHLRLLNLSLTRITELPESIECLRNLQFLGLRYCNCLHTLPKGIGKLQSLRSLDLRGTNLHQVLPCLENLKLLSTLHGFIVNCTPNRDDDPSGWPLEDLGSLNALRSLQILRMERVTDCLRMQKAMLDKKSHLKELELRCSTDDRQAEVREDDARTIKDTFDCFCPPQCLKSLKMVSYYAKLCPDWLPNLSNLQRLVISDCKFCERLPDLGQLTELKFLTITGFSKLLTIEQDRTTGNQAFPKLEQLHLKDMQNLESWVGFLSSDMPSLVKVRLDRCPKLRYLPSGIKYSKVLSSMHIHYADSLEVVEDLPVLKELVLQACNELTEISNLVLLEALIVISCSRLKDVNEVHYLRHARIEDRELRRLPEWLRSCASVLQTFTVVGSAELLERLLPNGQDWGIIRDINKVYANLPDESPFFTYTKDTADFHVDQRIIEHSKPPVSIAVGNVHEALTISLGNSADMVGRIGVPVVPVNQTSTFKRIIRRYLVPYLVVVMFVMQDKVKENRGNEVMNILKIFKTETGERCSAVAT
ncbi:hypothetical protein BRADI_1g27770v3 [Brachypodium distachyon]|uniref:NB-ARC domain-containing protein n=1 Tax=Brachypodium distachyon TaxID=15368 RepID=A0A0Q3RT42_BRADI|nr:hypothetical protein BRADI_1g27770v3 [Brachypodium distachyon]